MGKKILFSCLQLAVTVFLVASLVFLVLRILPGDPARAVLGMHAGEESIERFRSEFGLNDPVWRQYLRWIGGILRFDYGVSFANRQPVTPLIAQRLGITLSLAFGGIVVALVLSIPLAIRCAGKPWGRLDRVAMGVSHILMAFPEFWIGMILILVFAAGLGWFPLFGSGIGPHLVLPVFALGLNRAPILFRTLRGGLIQEARRPYVLFFLGAGVPERRLYRRYLFLNQLPGLTAIASIQLGYLLGGAIIIEQVFALPGLGRLLMTAILARDLPVVQGGVMLSSLVFSVMGFISDWAASSVKQDVDVLGHRLAGGSEATKR